MATSNASWSAAADAASGSPVATTMPPAAVLDFFFPGLSMFTNVLQRYLHIDLSLYFLPVLFFGCATFAWRYIGAYLYEHIEKHFMSTVEVRYDDEVYNMLMSWVTCQPFSRSARHFVVNTVLSSRARSVWDMQHYGHRYGWYDEDSDDDEDEQEAGAEEVGQDDPATPGKKRPTQKKALAYTPTFGQYYFWYHGRMITFSREQNRQSSSSTSSSEQCESVSLSCFGRDPAILKTLLLESRRLYLQRDIHKTVIYRGSKSSGLYGSGEASWNRCMARNPRPLSTVILNEQVKQDLVTDIADYLDPATRRWYANRGIPYRRGYLLYGPPGTGKSSLSVSLAGYFCMNIYIVSLNGAAATEETLVSLFDELPRRCIVLLEDIDTAGLTHTRAEGGEGDNSSESESDSENEGDSDSESPFGSDLGSDHGSHSGTDIRRRGRRDENGIRSKSDKGRLSLSGLLNILDGVASQEGRILIMTTNHVEKLDKALIRPGRVDMMLKFDRADRTMMAALFQSIFAPLEGDEPQMEKVDDVETSLETLAQQFADSVPELTFSPAELQGYLLKHKHDPAGAVAGVGAWVIKTQADKVQADKRQERKAAKKKAKEEAKKAREEKKAKKVKARKAKAKAKAKKAEKAEKTEKAEKENISDYDSDTEEESVKKSGKAKVEKNETPSSSSSSTDSSDEQSSQSRTSSMSTTPACETTKVTGSDKSVITLAITTTPYENRAFGQ